MPRATRRCPGDSYQCPNLASPGQPYCPDHTKAWQGHTTGQGSTRATRAARDDCLERARHRCQLRHAGCTTIATEAHHADGLADTGRRRADAADHGRLIAACHWCHDIETRQAAQRGNTRRKQR